MNDNDLKKILHYLDNDLISRKAHYSWGEELNSEDNKLSELVLKLAKYLNCESDIHDLNQNTTKYINNEEVAKYEGQNYWIYYDRQMVQYGCWVFVDTWHGHMETFNSKNEAFHYLKKYHLEYLKEYGVYNE